MIKIVQILIIFHLAFLQVFILQAQNLVPNASFEDYINCPTDHSEIYNCTGWYSVLPTPDYYNSCNGNSVSVPTNFNGDQIASTGVAYCGIYTYFPAGITFREVIGRQLSTTLIPGIKYYASIKVSLADRKVLASNNLGISFSTVSMENYSGIIPSTNYPQIYSQNIITDYTNWVTISGSFIADSAYQFIEIGNFLNDSLTSIVNSTSPSALYAGAYYYLDDVCVSQDSLTCLGIVGVSEIKIPTKKNLIRVLDIMGREVEDKPNTFLIFIYSDGTTEKKFRVE